MSENQATPARTELVEGQVDFDPIKIGIVSISDRASSGVYVD